MIPVVIVVDDETHALATPIVDQVAAAYRDAHTGDAAWALAMSLNGWTPEMIAWGKIVQGAVAAGMEVVIDQ